MKSFSISEKTEGRNSKEFKTFVVCFGCEDGGDVKLWINIIKEDLDFTMWKTLEEVQDPKGGIQGISLWWISRIRRWQLCC